MTVMATLTCLGALLIQTPDTGSVRITTYPATPVVERGPGVIYLNFDFGFENTGSDSLEIKRIELSVFDSSGRLAHRQFISAGDAMSPGLATVPDRIIPAGGALNLFNPFYSLPGHLDVARLRYQFIYELRGLEPVRSTIIEVDPVDRRPATRSILPVDGPAIVYDGHDFYSHHRRIPLGSAIAKRIGLAANPVRYANDLSPVGPDGALAKGSVAEPRNWYAYGAMVRAPASGTVTSVANDVADNTISEGELRVPAGAATDPLRAALGNHVVIKHAEGEYTVLAHLRAGTVRPKVGDRIEQGQPVGEIGFSGDTGLHVHLHHMMATAQEFTGEGLPLYYDRIRRVTLSGGAGRRGPLLMEARVDTGEIIESARPR